MSAQHPLSSPVEFSVNASNNIAASAFAARPLPSVGVGSVEMYTGSKSVCIAL